MNLDLLSSRASWLGRSLRWPLDRLPKTMAVPVLSGPLLAKRWIVGAGIHRCWLGTYERRKQYGIQAQLQEGMVACDIGANAGFYSMLMSRAVGKDGRVYAFEPCPRNLEFLRRHIELNGMRNVVVSNEAVSNMVGEAQFSTQGGSYQGKLDSSGLLRVPVVTLDHLFATGRLPPTDLIKIDVEGAELHVLQGATVLLKRFRPVVFLATHGLEVHEQCCELLVACGYRLRTLDGVSSVGLVDEIVASTR